MSDKNEAIHSYGPLIGALEQGPFRSRFSIFKAETSELVTYHEVDISIEESSPGWTQSDAGELLISCITCINRAVEHLQALGANPNDIKTIGVCNQREALVVWDRKTGLPLAPILLRGDVPIDSYLVKCPQRSLNYLRPLSGLPLSSYFSAPKLKWLMDNTDEVDEALNDERLMVGTIDTWIVWNLTGGFNGGVYVTDVTNASRTNLMNINTLQWDPFLCYFFDIPLNILPEIRSSSEVYGTIKHGSLEGVTISAILGDQQASLLGHMCVGQGQVKNTYSNGGGLCLMVNTGNRIVHSEERGLVTTVAYQMSPESHPVYALEGLNTGATGGPIRWLTDTMTVASDLNEIDQLSSHVTNSSGVHFVPALNGFLAPYWDQNAKGMLCGLTSTTTRGHMCRAIFESLCHQTRQLLDRASADCELNFTQLFVDGSTCSSDHLMQLQADLLGIPVVRSTMSETSALGAAMAAGEAIGMWKNQLSNDVTNICDDVFVSRVDEDERDARYEMWLEAIERSRNWKKDENKCRTDSRERLLASLPSVWFLVSSFAVLVLADYLKRSGIS